MIKGNKKSKLYEKILKLTESNSREDLEIAKILLIENMWEFTHKQFEFLADEYYMNHLVGSEEEITIADIHKHFYDKRQQEKTANKGKHTI